MATILSSNGWRNISKTRGPNIKDAFKSAVHQELDPLHEGIQAKDLNYVVG